MSIEKAYNSWAKQYDNNENKTRDLDKKATISTLSNYKFNTVIELGCGTGKNTLWLLKNAQKIIGLDFSQEMLKKAKEKINTASVVFKKADFTKPWGIENEFADLITSNLTLEHIKNLDVIFKQTSKKLKPNGLFFISELHPFKQYSGSKARFESESGTVELEVYTHHISEYLNSAKKYNFKLIEINEWFDQSSENEIPRLISFIFKK
ncbi:class I SAM-dependent methyltransferase [Lutibacter sp.]